MLRKTFSGLIFIILLTGILTFTINIQPVKASGTIYIRSDGSIDPPTAPLLRNGNIYTLTNNVYISDSDIGIDVQRSHIVIDGAGHILEATGTAYGTGIGIVVSYSSNVTIKNTEIKGFFTGIQLWYSVESEVSTNNIADGGYATNLWYSSGNNISGNNMVNHSQYIIRLGYSSNNILSRNNITTSSYFNQVFTIFRSSSNSISENVIIGNARADWAGEGIGLYWSLNNSVCGNSVTNCKRGIRLSYSNNNSFSRNSVTNSTDKGIYLEESSYNYIYHNSFSNNSDQVYVARAPSIDTWDNGYPSGGNYWSDYTGVDLYSGPYQNETGGDGIWDHPYVIDADNQDRYPLTNPWRACIGSPWPMFLHDVQHTGRSPYVGSGKPNLKWSFTTEGILWASPVIGSDGTIYVGSDDGKLYAINFDGSLKWSFDAEGPIRASPALAGDGTIYVGADSMIRGRFYALNPNGSLKWETTIDYHDYGQIGLSSPAIGNDGTIYVGSAGWNRNFWAIDPNGTKKWGLYGSWEGGPGGPGSSPAIGLDGTIYVGSAGYTFKEVYAINPNGSIKWKFSTGSGVESSPSIAPDGTIYVHSYDGNLYAINTDGSLNWSLPIGNLYRASFSIASDGTIYVGGSEDGKLYAISPDGSLKWNFTTTGRVYFAPAIDAIGTIYAGSSDKNFYVISPDGSLKWNFTIGGIIISPSAIGSDGTIYVGSADKRLYAFGLALPGPDFSITASPTSLTIPQDNADTCEITVTSINGFNQPVQLTVSGAPSGVTAALSPEQVTPPPDGSTTSTLTVSVDTTATPGSYTLTITGTSGALTHSTYISLEIPPPSNQPPNKPTAVSQYRSDGATVIPEGGITPESTVVFKATISDSDGDSVRLEIELRQIGEAFTGEPTPETISDFVPSGTEVTITRSGLVNADYHWQYRAKDSKGAVSDWTEFGATGNIDFTVSLPQTPTITGIDPPQPIALAYQYLTINGEGFVPDSEVNVTDGLKIYRIPRERTRFIDPNRIEVVVGLGYTEGAWKAWIINPGGIQSNKKDFQTRKALDEDIMKVLALALQYTTDPYEWTVEDALIMTAIAGGESGWSPNTAGDLVKDWGTLWDKNKLYNPMINSMGSCSWGLWQILMPAHLDDLKKLANTEDYDEIAKWLRDPNNNVRAAYEVWKVQGFKAWSAYTQTQEPSYYKNPSIWDRVINIAKRMSIFKGPVNVTIIDEYGRIISEVENQIPGASFEYFNATDTKIFYLPLNLTYHVQINATAYGNCTIGQITSTESIYEIAFSQAAFNLTSATVAELDLLPYEANYTLEVDENGDGLIDYELTPEMRTMTTEYDIGVTETFTSRNILGEGYYLPINTTVKNYGAHSETFNVTLYVNETFVERQSITLTNGTSATITFLWNTTGFTRGNYTISVIADPVSGETYTEDNTLIGSWVMVTIPGDVDGDRDVDIYDVVKITGIYGSKRGDPQFNPNSDLDDDGEIKIYDVVICTSHYGQSG